MEDTILRSESVNSEALSTHELLILHTADGQEWASYLQQILKSSRKFHKRSILLYAISPDDQLHGYNFDYFRSCKCIVLLITGVFLDILCDHELQAALQRLLYPPHRVVALLCGVSEEEVSVESFTDWASWRKIYHHDEPAVYVATILEAVNDSRQAETKHESTAASAMTELHITAASSTENPVTDVTEEQKSAEQEETVTGKDEEPLIPANSASEETGSSTHLTCLTIQPSRVLCGKLETLFIILKHKIDLELVPEVEFSSENVAAKRVRATVENEYTISVTAADMPTGVVSLTLCTDQPDQPCVSLGSVTYYTSMEEVSQYLENASDPVSFICQAFSLTSNSRESVDNMLTDSLKSRMPATGFQLFGIRQIEEYNMSANQRKEELPTLLHFSAKYGLKKLTTILLQCPGALQAYSVRNKNGDYPNTLAEKSGFSDLRQFIDEFVETADMLKCHIEDAINTDNDGNVYELMTTTSQDILMKYSCCSEDIYETMFGLDPECTEDLYEAMDAVDQNPEDAMLRKFFQAKPNSVKAQNNTLPFRREENDKEGHLNSEQINEYEEHGEHGREEEEEEDPYKLMPEDIYDTVDANTTYPIILNRPPAPIPRPESESDAEKPMAYISRVFSDKSTSQTQKLDGGYSAARPLMELPTSAYDPYAGMKTPGQRQLISLQERVKVGEITVDEAVQEFKAWQFDHERRANSIRYQQENLKKLRESINRRHKEREKIGKDLEYEITPPLQRNLYWDSSMTLECAVYEPTPRMVVTPSVVSQPIQRGSWKTGSTSSTSSSESNRFSTHSNFSYSSGTEPDFEDISEHPPPPPRPPRPSDPPPVTPPPRIPPRTPERVPEMVHERYISCPTRALPQRPSHRPTDSAPPIPRRNR